MSQKQSSFGLSDVVIIAGTFLVLSVIQIAFGRAASVWFGLGALATSAFAFWEAGRKP